MDNKSIPCRYRPIPFWSWNDRLYTEETQEQIARMHEAGIGGFFMHARGGLETPYMGEAWFENIEAAIETAEALHMRPWAYDENGWPSGFGNGSVNGVGEIYQQKRLCMGDMPVMSQHEAHIIAKGEKTYFYWDVNPYYVDVLSYEAIRLFIKNSYEPYYARYGNRIEGMFTDEPQMVRTGVPWSIGLEQDYERRYGEALIPRLEELFLPVGEYRRTRIRFYKLVTDRFSQAYVKQIYDWCDARGLKLTGHLLYEETLLMQLGPNGACMPHYEYFHIPGMDWLRRRTIDCLTARQVSSVSEQLGKEAVLSETFALCGHGISMAELKGIYEWQMVRGVNLLCPHLQGYTLRGIRKRDYPPAMYIQQPWWSVYDQWIEAMSRIGMILSKGNGRPRVLLVHPQTTAWAMYDGGQAGNADIEALNARFLSAIRMLEEKHIEFHLGDETIIERHGRAEGGKLVIGEQSYDCVITECCGELLESTKTLLAEYAGQGGRIAELNEIVENPVIDDKTITYTSRECEQGRVHYFVNTDPQGKTANILLKGRRLDAYTGEWLPFDGVHRFEPWGSLMILEDGMDNILHEPRIETEIALDGEFEVAPDTMNVMTLDRCDYFFDGEQQEENGYILNVCERAIRLERRVNIDMRFRVQVEDVPGKLYLVTETPEQFNIFINGERIDQTVCGYFVDKSFKTIDIARYICRGENIIRYVCDFEQPPEFYAGMRRARVFESELNKLVYGMEIEAIYLLGNFSVRTDGTWTALDRNAVRYAGQFAIGAPVRKITLSHIEQQGFPFFCGEMTVCGEIDIQGDHPVLHVGMKGINAVRVQICDFTATKITDFRIPLDSLPRGRHVIQLTMIGNLRNMLGPHHLEEGESYIAGPFSFYKEDCVWSKPALCGLWNEDYCLIEIGQ